MSEDRTEYKASYIAESPQQFKVGDYVEVVDAGGHRESYMGWEGYVIENPNPSNGCVRVQFRNGKSIDFKPEWLRKLTEPTPITFENEKTMRFRGIVGDMAELYKIKNADYNDSFSMSVRKYGLISALTRISDKFNRFENLALGAKQNVTDESIKDTLKDLASYCVMTIMAIEENNFEKF